MGPHVPAPGEVLGAGEVALDSAVTRLLVLDGIIVGVRPLFVTKEVAAEMLGCSLSLVNAYIRLRMLPANFHGTKPVISLKELETFATRLPTEPRSLRL